MNILKTVLLFTMSASSFSKLTTFVATLAPVECHFNGSGPAMCPSGSSCCRGQFWQNICRTGTSCNVCAECCHDELQNVTDCNACVKASCVPGSYGGGGCALSPSPTHLNNVQTAPCCPGGQLSVSTTPALPNCLLIGDSVAHGTFALVKQLLNKTCVVSNIESVSSGAEDACFWSTAMSAQTGEPVKWSVIHYNEGLHSLWPRVNTTEELTEWAFELGNFTETLKKTGANLVYATMTPFMPEKYLNPNRSNLGPMNPINDVEMKNGLAVKTVRALGVTMIDDLYDVVTAVCGDIYRNCSLCDDESQYHPQGQCGYHYSSEGWELLAHHTAQYIAAALHNTTQHNTTTVDDDDDDGVGDDDMMLM